MTDHRGVYNKYTVTRNDGKSGPGEEHEHCRYFVLDLDHDDHAAAALAAYADSCADGKPELAADLREYVKWCEDYAKCNVRSIGDVPPSLQLGPSWLLRL